MKPPPDERERAELLQDVHVYGGGAVASLGLALAYLPAGIALFGVLLVYLGLRSR